jgi:hypothetical protein
MSRRIRVLAGVSSSRRREETSSISSADYEKRKEGRLTRFEIIISPDRTLI